MMMSSLNQEINALTAIAILEGVTVSGRHNRNYQKATTLLTPIYGLPAGAGNALKLIPICFLLHVLKLHSQKESE
jgi:hypothetical protein